MAAGIVLCTGCGSATQTGTSTHRPAASTGATAKPPPAKPGSIDQRRAQGAVLARLRRHRYKAARVSCQNIGRHRFDCRVSGAQLWLATVTPSGSVHLRLLGSE
jgi:hypothetical protein